MKHKYLLLPLLIMICCISGCSKEPGRITIERNENTKYVIDSCDESIRADHLVSSGGEILTLREIPGSGIIINDGPVISLNENETVDGFLCDGSYYYLLSTVNSDRPWDRSYGLYRIGKNGNDICYMSLGDMNAEEIIGFDTDGKGRLCILTSDCIYFADPSVDDLSSFVPDDLFMMALAYDGKSGSLAVIGEKKGALYTLLFDPEEKDFSGEYLLDLNDTIVRIEGLGIGRGFGKSSFLINDSIYELDIDVLKMTLKLDLGLIGIEADIGCIAPEGDLTVVYGQIRDSNLTGLIRIDSIEIDKEKVLSMTVLYDQYKDSSALRTRVNKALLSYNLNSDDSMIDVLFVPYDDMQNVIMSISIGNGPDIICSDSGHMSGFISSGALIPIDDSVYKDADVNDNIKNAMKTDGDYLFATPFFMIKVLASGNNTGSGARTVFEFMKNVTAVHAGNIIRHDDAVRLMGLFEPYITSAFKTGELNEATLAEIIDYCDENSSLPYSENESIISLIRDGRLIFIDNDLYGFPRFILESSVFENAPVFLPYPGMKSPLMISDECYAVTACCSQRDLAEQFISGLFAYDYQYDVAADHLCGFPIPANTEAFDTIVEEYSEKYENGDFTSEGIRIGDDIFFEPEWFIRSDSEEERIADYTKDLEDAVRRSHQGERSQIPSLDLPELPRIDIVKTADAYRDLYHSEMTVYIPNNDLNVIIFEETAPVWEGQTSPGEAAKIIKGRAGGIG